MCKVLIIPNASKIENFDEFSRFIAEVMHTMRDGYGYAAMGSSGVFGLKTLNPEGYALGVKVPDFCVSVESIFGVVGPVVGPAIFHGRVSTNTIDIVNTHPIRRDGWNLIHNGVVTNHGESYNTLTSNDSEHVLYHLIKGIDSVGTNLTGCYAGGAIDPNGTLHVFRDAIAPLFYAYSQALESPIFATTLEMIDEIGVYLGEALTGVSVKPNHYLVYRGNELIKQSEFTSRGYDALSASLSGRSLGYDLQTDDDSLDVGRNGEAIEYQSDLANDDAPGNDSFRSYWDTHDALREEENEIEWVAEYRSKVG